MFSLQLVGQNDFRKMNWGDSPADLKANYPEVSWETETYEDYKLYATEGIIGGLEAIIAYVFTDDKLQSGYYQFKESHSSTGNLYYEDFVSISSFLSKKYDMERTENWNDSSWKGKEDQIGFAISMGHVEIEERYEDERTAVVHSISGDKLQISHSIAYASMEFVNSIREAALDDF